MSLNALLVVKDKTSAYANAGVKVQPYDIPLRALVARDVDSLLMAGRCISGDFIAHASYRVTGNATSMGEAAGAVAALAAKTARLPHDVPGNEAVALLTKIGHRAFSGVVVGNRRSGSYRRGGALPTLSTERSEYQAVPFVIPW